MDKKKIIKELKENTERSIILDEFQIGFYKFMSVQRDTSEMHKEDFKNKTSQLQDRIAINKKSLEYIETL